MIRHTVRTARRRHACERCRATIRPGDAHLEAVASPHHDDLGNVGWWRLRQCVSCALLHGETLPPDVYADLVVQADPSCEICCLKRCQGWCGFA